MKKLLIRFLWLILILLAGIVLYVAGILLINTALDYKPDEGEHGIEKFANMKPARIGDTLAILSWNIGYAGLGSEADFFYDGGKMSRPAKKDYLQAEENIMASLRSHDQVEFILLQEVDFRSKRSYNIDQFGLAEGCFPDHAGAFVKNYDVAFVPMPVFSPMGSVESGIAFFANKRIIRSKWRAYDMDRSWPLGLFLPDRCYSVSVVQTDTSRLLYIFNTHNSAFDDGHQRNSQLQQLYAEMVKAYEEGHYVITGGDWNLNPCGYENATFVSSDISFEIDNLQNVCGPGDLWQVVYDPRYPSNRDVSEPYRRGETPTTILDFFVCSPNISVLGVNTLYDGFSNSDHHPVQMRFRLD